MDGGNKCRAAHPGQYLCEVQLQLPPAEVGLVEFYSRSCRRFGLAEVYPDSSKAFEQLKCNLVIIDGEKCLESLLQMEEQQGRQNGGNMKRKTFNKRKFKSSNPRTRVLHQKAVDFSDGYARTGVLLFTGLLLQVTFRYNQLYEVSYSQGS